MVALSNTPRQQTVMTLEARRGYAFGLSFKRKATGLAVDLSGCTVRLVVKEPRKYGSDECINVTASLIGNPVLGVVEFALQSDTLDLNAGEYTFAITLTSALGYPTTVLKGVINILDNADQTVPVTPFPLVNPSTNLAVYMEEGDVVEVHVDNLDGVAFVISEMLNDAQGFIDQAGDLATAASQSASTASTAAGTATGAASAANASKNQAAASAQAAADDASDAHTDAQVAQSASAEAHRSEIEAAGSADIAARAAGAAQEAADQGGGVGGLDVEAVNHGSFDLDGTWDFTDANLIGVTVGNPTLSIDTDGVPYFDPDGPENAIVQADTDGVPFFTLV